MFPRAILYKWTEVVKVYQLYDPFQQIDNNNLCQNLLFVSG